MDVIIRYRAFEDGNLVNLEDSASLEPTNQLEDKSPTVAIQNAVNIKHAKWTWNNQGCLARDPSNVDLKRY